MSPDWVNVFQPEHAGEDLPLSISERACAARASGQRPACDRCATFTRALMNSPPCTTNTYSCAQRLDSFAHARPESTSSHRL